MNKVINILNNKDLQELEEAAKGKTAWECLKNSEYFEARVRVVPIVENDPPVRIIEPIL